MIIPRDLWSELTAWQQDALHLPLLLRGARQVGKTFLIERFGQSCFKHMVAINFELSTEYIACFDTLKPNEIINKIEVISGQSIIPGQTLLFLDEIQACPNAIMALRYFKEQLPKLHVIGAGSLLEFALQAQGMRMPVGRVQYLYLKPLSFREYLRLLGQDNLISWLNQLSWDSDIAEVLHQRALKLVQEYMVIGGMPMVVDAFVQAQSARKCQSYQTLLLNTYSDDFAKYANTPRHKYLQKVYDRTPSLVGQQIKYRHIAADMDSRYLKQAIQDLSQAGVINPIYATSAAGLPLSSDKQEKKFKLLFLDIGLLKRATKLDIDLLLADDLLLLNRGALAEQFVGQELLAYQAVDEVPELYYWSRDKTGSMAEVDYLVQVGRRIIPIEVKAGKTGSLKSMHQLMQEKHLEIGVRVSAKKLQREGKIVSIPFYLLADFERLINQL